MNGKLGSRRSGAGLFEARFANFFHALGLGMTVLAAACDARIPVLDRRDAAAEGSDSGSIDRTTDAGELADGFVAADGGVDASRVEELVPEAILAMTRPIAAAHCEWFETCLSGTFRSAFLGGFEHCVSNTAGFLGQEHALGHTPHPSTWCIPTLANDADCDALPDCTQPPGTLAEGEECLSPRECGLTATGEPMECRGCRCQPRLNEGDVCVGSLCDLDESLVCAAVDGTDDLRCMEFTFVADGEACAYDERRVCELGSWCLEGTCVPRPRMGDVCDPEGAPCMDPIGQGRPEPSYCREGDAGVSRCLDPLDDVVGGGEACTPEEGCAGGGPCPSTGVCPAFCQEQYSCGPGENCVDGECVVTRRICRDDSV